MSDSKDAEIEDLLKSKLELLSDLARLVGAYNGIMKVIDTFEPELGDEIRAICCEIVRRYEFRNFPATVRH